MSSARFRLHSLKTFHDTFPYRLVIVEPFSRRVVPIHGRDEFYAPDFGVSFLRHSFLGPAITGTFHACLERPLCDSYPFWIRNWLLNEAGLRRRSAVLACNIQRTVLWPQIWVSRHTEVCRSRPLDQARPSCMRWSPSVAAKDI